MKNHKDIIVSEVNEMKGMDVRRRVYYLGIQFYLKPKEDS